VKCLHEIFFDAAIKDAEGLDEYFEKNGKPVGPLHGLPVSLKDQMHVKGVETTMGYVGVSFVIAFHYHISKDKS
jgi:amidase